MTRWRRGRPKGRYLERSINLRVRFNEVDSLRIVWHGHFLKYFEDGRGALGRQYGISYLDLLDAGLLVPIVSASCQYYQPARYGDELTVTARLYEQESAKIFFYYEVNRSEDGVLLAAGRTVQAFLDMDGNLLITLPDFMRAFYARWQDEMLVSHG